MKKFSLFAILLGFNIALGACSDDDAAPVVKDQIFQLPEKAYVLAEQSRRAIVIRDAETHRNIWSWDPYTACVPAAQQGWFVNPSEVKPVFNRRYILMTASGGAVALIRLSDHKLMFYANCGQNPHSAEVLPDGNIVTAESKSGEINTFAQTAYKQRCDTYHQQDPEYREGFLIRAHELVMRIMQELTRKRRRKRQVHPFLLIQEVLVHDTGQIYSRKEGYQDTDNQRRGKSTDRTCSEIIQDDTRNDRSQVGVENS